MRDIASFIALNRFGMGAGPEDGARPGDDPRGWLKAQIRPLAPIPGDFRPSEAIIADIFTARLDRPNRQAEAVRAAIRDDFRPSVRARTARAIATARPLPERMAHFWSNHFTVSTTRRVTAAAIPAYEREAIRPHVFGRFADMLMAVVRHPCMLTYLDNIASMGPDSPAGRTRRANRGVETTLNENLAREILELHTLGVDGGYDQEDVIQLALALTGWSHGGLRRGGEGDEVHGRFQFFRRQHQPGAKTVLGRRYDEAGADEGLAILDDLARHPATARHLATKLVRHFVADDPPAADVDHIARVFQDSDGDLAEVTRALIDLPSAWAEPLAKVKTHYEFIIAVHRAIGPEAPRARDLFRPLRMMGNEPFTAPSPQGWGDRAGDWISPEALMLRLEWAQQYAAGVPGGYVPRELLQATIGPVARQVTETWLLRAPSGDQALTLLFGSPEFQRR